MSLAFHEASLHDELLGLIAILVLAQDAGSSHGVILVSKSNSGVALEVLSQTLQSGTLNCQTQHGVLHDHVINACLTQLLTELGVVLDVNAAVSDDAAGNRTLKLCLQISDVSLLFRKNLCTGHSVSPRFKNLYRKPEQ
jgi:hypothetical protein